MTKKSLNLIGINRQFRQIMATWQDTKHMYNLVFPKANSAFHFFGVGKWVPASAGKAKEGMVHSVSGWTRGVQVKLWDSLRTRAIPERLRGVFTTRRYTNPGLPLPYLLNKWTPRSWGSAVCQCHCCL